MKLRRLRLNLAGTSRRRFTRARLSLTLTAAFLPVVAHAQIVKWAQSGGGPSNDQGCGIAAGAAGNSYVTGRYAGTATFGPFVLSSAGHEDIFVAKYATACCTLDELLRCLAGPGTTAPQNCLCNDADLDSDIDLRDYASLRAASTCFAP